MMGLLAGALSVAGQEKEAPAKPDLAVQEVSPGVFSIGKVRLDKALRTVQFPAVLNMDESILEYLLVTEAGKIHESLLRTEAEPYHIHVAMLLLGAKGAGTNAIYDVKPTEIPGEKVGVDVSWDGPTGRKNVPAEHMVWNRQERRPMVAGPWVYTGSLVLDGVFLAQQDGSIISLIVDPTAVVNNPRLGAENDELWLVNTNGLPPLNSPVEVTLRLMPAPKPDNHE